MSSANAVTQGVVVPVGPGRDPATRVAAAQLSVGYTPRHSPVDDGHVRMLMEVLELVPPIVVHRRTMTVIDGVHRLEAFRRAGWAQVPAVLFDGDECAALVMAVEANVAHGKPLSLSERRAAASGLLAHFSERSDRWIAQVCGLSHSTVARLRSGATELDPALEVTSRVGRDGRRRPVAPPVQGAAVPPTCDGGRPRVAILEDPALRATPELVEFASWFTQTQVVNTDIERYLSVLPLGRIYDVADECRQRARHWAAIADAIERSNQARPAH